MNLLSDQGTTKLQDMLITHGLCMKNGKKIKKEKEKKLQFWNNNKVAVWPKNLGSNWKKSAGTIVLA